MSEKAGLEGLGIWEAKHRYALESSESYLVLEERPEKVLAVFADCVHKGFKGLCVTREHPKKIQRQCDLGGTRIFWLREHEQETENVIEDLLEVSLLIGDFIDATNSIVLLDGLEYLVSRHGFEPVYHFVQNTRDKISAADAIMLISVHPRAFDEARLALLKRELRLLDYPVKASNIGYRE